MKLLLDCDPGHDDAIALLYAACHLDMLAITTVYGNQSLDHTTRNALSLCRLSQLDVPVARGAAKPLLGSGLEGGTLHGSTGLDGATLPVPDRDCIDEHAVDLILRLARQHRGELVIAATGPLTNIALALSVEPRLREWLRGITVMGGTSGVGNCTQIAEFNIYCDPEAADIVLGSGVPLWMVGLDVTRRVGVDAEGIATLRHGGILGHTIADLLDFYLSSLNQVHGLSTASLHDPCALVPFIDPTLLTYRQTHVAVELASSLTRGMTVCDLRNLSGGSLGHIRPSATPNVQLAREPTPGLVPHILDAIRKMDARLR